MRPVWLWLVITAVGIVYGLASSRAALAQDWQYPIAVAAGDDGAVYVADRNLPGIWTLKEGRTEILVKASRKFRTPLNAVRCLSVGRDGGLLAGDSATREVFRVGASGALTQLTAEQPAMEQTTLTDDLSFSPENFGLIGVPMAMASNSSGDLFVADTELQRVWKVPSGSRTPEEFLVVGGPRGSPLMMRTTFGCCRCRRPSCSECLRTARQRPSSANARSSSRIKSPCAPMVRRSFRMDTQRPFGPSPPTGRRTSGSAVIR